ncbi:MAG: TadA family conjugal transfer-associated ATPase [Propionibacteriaceae bacterium]
MTAVQPADLAAVRDRVALLGRPPTPADVADALRGLGRPVTDAGIVATCEALRRESVGAGPLDALLRIEGVTDVLVNGADRVYIDRGDGVEPSSVTFANEAEVRRLAQRLAARVGRRLDDSVPFVDARLPDGTRVHAVLGSLADPGTCISLRVPSRSRLTLDGWVNGGGLTPAGADLLRHLVAARVAFLVAGGTGSGKTTLLGTLLGLVSADERLVIIEDSRELSPDHPHCIRLEGRPDNAEQAGAVTLTDLVRQGLRMRPDRLVLGEVRGAELTDLLTAMNTGHEGGCGTVHANSAAAVPARLEALGALGGLGRDALHAQLAAALDVVVQIRRGGRRRWVSELGVLERCERSGLVQTVLALSFDPDGTTRRGPGIARLEELLAGAGELSVSTC